MLARSFKSADDLRISDKQHTALIGVLGMLERGELLNLYEPRTRSMRPLPRDAELFDMSTFDGPACCIGGWADRKYGTDFASQYSRLNGYFDSTTGRITIRRDRGLNGALSDLLFVEHGGVSAAPSREGMPLFAISTAQAAQALNNYLTTGNANWREVLTTI